MARCTCRLASLVLVLAMQQTLGNLNLSLNHKEQKKNNGMSLYFHVRVGMCVRYVGACEIVWVYLICTRVGAFVCVCANVSVCGYVSVCARVCMYVCMDG